MLSVGSTACTSSVLRAVREPPIPPRVVVAADVPVEARAEALRGWMAVAEGDAATARTAAEAALRLDPGRPALLRLLAEARGSAGDAEGARAALDQALAIDPDDPWCLRARALRLRASGDVTAAIVDLRRAGLAGRAGTVAKSILEGWERELAEWESAASP
jgi:cytochrome c-type biogenesis protein CcmH/NrfG